MRKVAFGLIVGLTVSGSGNAQVDPHSIAPPAILQMDAQPNAGQLFVRYCLLGACVDRSTSCHGDCCWQGEADAIGYGCSGDVYGIIPPGFHYAGWSCKPYGTPTYDMPLKGEAGPKPKHPEQCNNLR